MSKKRIGELLVERGYVTPVQVEQALEIQKTKRERICNILMDLGYLSEESFLKFLSEFPGTASVELSHCEIDREVLDLVPSELGVRLELVPIGRMRNLLTVAMVCPLDEAGRNELEEVTGLTVKPVLCSRGAVYKALDRYYGRTKEVEKPPVEEADTSVLEGPLKLRRVAKLVEEIEELPTLPDIVNAISLAANDPNSSSADVAKIIATDGALSAKILKLANSPAFGFSRKVTDIKHAVALLGFKETQALAMSVSVFNYLIDKTDLDFKAYWNHSFTCATMARLISFGHEARMTDSAFVAGLLHDVGKVVLAMSMHGKQARATSLRSTTGTTALEAEETVLGITHAEVGYLLADHWLLPTALANAIRYHHLPELEPEPRGPASGVSLANTFCKLSASEFEKATAFDDNVLEALNVLHMSEGAFRKTLDVYRDIASDITVF